MDLAKGKNAQLAIFFLMALILFLGFLYGASLEREIVDYQTEKVAEEFLTTQDFENIQNSISLCLRNVLEKGIELLELGGGYLEPQKSLATLRTEQLTITYLHHQKKSYLPSLAFMEQQLNRYVEEEMPYCMADFKHLTENDGIILPGTPDAEVAINLEDVSVQFHYPFKVGSEQREDNEFRAVIPSKLLKAYVEASRIIETGNKQSSPQDLKISSHHYPDTMKTIWVIEDDGNAKKKHFVFATKSSLEKTARQYAFGEGEKTCFDQEGITCLEEEYCENFDWMAASDTDSCCKTTCRKLNNGDSQIVDISGGIFLTMTNDDEVAVCWGTPSDVVEEPISACPREHPRYSPATRIGQNEYSFKAEDEEGTSKVYRVKTITIGDKLIAEELYI